jgi:TnpA family transposase
VIATIMAYGCNLGPETMAQLTERVSYEDIQGITDWYLYDEAQRAALADIVNAMLALDTTQVWGDGHYYQGPQRLRPRYHAGVG